MKASHSAGNDASPGAAADLSPEASDDASLLEDCDVSPGTSRDTRRGEQLEAYPNPSPRYPDDPSPTPGRSCAWCRAELPATARRDARFCSKACRQFAFRLRRRAETLAVDAESKRLGYADPPYPGKAWRYYQTAEVDHAELVARLATFDGWALSTSAEALRDVLPLCPPEVRVCAWVKPIGASPQTLGIHNTWEPVIVLPARRLRPGKRDWLRAMPARGGGDLPGRKPIAFVAWLLGLLGAAPGDDLVDLFPGTGVLSRAWRELRTMAETGEELCRAEVGK